MWLESTPAWPHWKRLEVGAARCAEPERAAAAPPSGRGESGPPRAADCHCGSVGRSRDTPDVVSIRSQKRRAACQLTRITGCSGRLTAFSETEDGRYMITLSGMSRFRIVKEVEGFTPYRRCEVAANGFERDLGPTATDTQFDRAEFMNLRGRRGDERGLFTDWQSLQVAEDEPRSN